MTTEIAPTERCAYFRFTFPEASDAYVVVDAFDRGSYVKVIPEENKIVGYTTRNSGGVPQNFRNSLCDRVRQSLLHLIKYGRTTIW